MVTKEYLDESDARCTDKTNVELIVGLYNAAQDLGNLWNKTYPD